LSRYLTLHCKNAGRGARIDSPAMDSVALPPSLSYP
jgi:hypothetical protein